MSRPPTSSSGAGPRRAAPASGPAEAGAKGHQSTPREDGASSSAGGGARNPARGHDHNPRARQQQQPIEYVPPHRRGGSGSVPQHADTGAASSHANEGAEHGHRQPRSAPHTCSGGSHCKGVSKSDDKHVTPSRSDTSNAGAQTQQQRQQGQSRPAQSRPHVKDGHVNLGGGAQEAHPGPTHHQQQSSNSSGTKSSGSAGKRGGKKGQEREDEKSNGGAERQSKKGQGRGDGERSVEGGAGGRQGAVKRESGVERGSADPSPEQAPATGGSAVTRDGFSAPQRPAAPSSGDLEQW